MTHAAFGAESGGVVLGGWLTCPSAGVLDTLRRSDLHYVGIDCQHAAIDEGAAMALLTDRPGPGPALLVRVARNEPAPIGRVLDAGADGVIVPMIESVDQAVAAVAACRYMPAGTRSFGPIRGDLGTDPAAIEDRASCFVMIETEPALRAVDDICAVPGVAGVYVGPGDLSLALGLDPVAAFTTDQLDEPLRAIRSACAQAGVIFGIHSTGGSNARHWIERGARMVTLGSDQSLLLGAVSHQIDVALGTARGDRPATSPYA